MATRSPVEKKVPGGGGSGVPELDAVQQRLLDYLCPRDKTTTAVLCRACNVSEDEGRRVLDQLVKMRLVIKTPQMERALWTATADGKLWSTEQVQKRKADRSQRQQTVVERQDQANLIYATLGEFPASTARQLSDHLHLDSRDVYRALIALRDHGDIRTIGHSPARWVMCSPSSSQWTDDDSAPPASASARA